jgi:hypothetical protein
MFQQTRRAMCGLTARFDYTYGVMPKTNHGERVLRRGDDTWLVREMNSEHVPGARAAHCLICESNSVVRRLWTYPDDWLTLSDDELLSLCMRGAQQ